MSQQGSGSTSPQPGPSHASDRADPGSPKPNPSHEPQQAGPTSPQPGPSNASDQREAAPCESAFQGDLEVFSWVPAEPRDMILAMDPQRIIEKLRQQLRKKTAIRWYLSIKVEIVKYDAAGNEIRDIVGFTSRCCQLTRSENSLEQEVEEAIGKILRDFENYVREGSGWQLDSVLEVSIHTGRYKPLRGCSYIPLPKTFRLRHHGVINIKNNDEKCFLWSVLAALHPQAYHPERVQCYLPYKDELNLDGIQLPMSLKQISKFEKQNNISINVFGYEDDIFPLHISSFRFHQHVNL